MFQIFKKYESLAEQDEVKRQKLLQERAAQGDTVKGENRIDDFDNVYYLTKNGMIPFFILLPNIYH